MTTLYEFGQMTQEAFCVQHGLPVDRRHTDEELAETSRILAGITSELNNSMNCDERIKAPSVSEVQSSTLNYRVTVFDKHRNEVVIFSPIPANCPGRAFMKAMDEMLKYNQDALYVDGLLMTHEIVPPLLRRVK
jgi:hypothetical protein